MPDRHQRMIGTFTPGRTCQVCFREHPLFFVTGAFHGKALVLQVCQECLDRKYGTGDPRGSGLPPVPPCPTETSGVRLPSRRQ